MIQHKPDIVWLVGVFFNFFTHPAYVLKFSIDGNFWQEKVTKNIASTYLILFLPGKAVPEGLLFWLRL